MGRSQEQRQLSQSLVGARQGVAMSDYVAGSMHELRIRQEAASAVRIAADRERAAADREIAANDRALRRRARADYLATLTRRERAIERFRLLRRLGLVWLAVSILLAGAAIIAAALAGASAMLGLLGTLYISALLLTSKVVRTRQRRLTPEHVEKVAEQLDRVKASLPTN